MALFLILKKSPEAQRLACCVFACGCGLFQEENMESPFPGLLDADFTSRPDPGCHLSLICHL